MRVAPVSRMLEWLLTHATPKLAIVAIFAAIGAALPKDLTLRQRLMTFFVGFVAALVFGEPVRETLGASDSWGYGMAGIIAMTGRNVAVYIIRASKDPAAAAREILEVWRARGEVGKRHEMRRTRESPAGRPAGLAAF